jgi:integrase
LDSKDLTVKKIIEFLTLSDDEISFSDYAREYIADMAKNGMVRNSQNYRCALQHLERFLGTTEILFSHLSSKVLNRWIQQLEKNCRAKEMYPVCIRMIYKSAIQKYNDPEIGLIRITSNPWVNVKIPQSERPEKQAISAEECREFFSAPLPKSPFISPLPEFGRDVAKLMLCLAGMNTVDLYELKKKNYRNGIICYNRAKTRRSRRDDAYIEMRVEPIIKPLIEKYRADDDDPYLFNFHKRYCDSDSFCANVNTGIRKLCKSMGMSKEQSYHAYVFRHTWATIAQNDCGASIADVSFALNHSFGNKVTRGYIKIDFSAAWELNANVIEFVFFSNKPSKLGKAFTQEKNEEQAFRITPKKMINAKAYFKGEILAEITDVGFANLDDVLKSIVAKLPDSIPNRCDVQFRITNLDTGAEAVYERTKGRGKLF